MAQYPPLRRDNVTHTYRNPAAFNQHSAQMRQAGWQIGPHTEQNGKATVLWYRDVPPSVAPNAFKPPAPRGGLHPLAIVGIVLASLIVLAIIGGAISNASRTPTPAISDVGATSAGSATSGGKPTVTPLPSLNQVASAKNWDITATAVEKPGQVLAKTKAAGTWLVVSLDVTNTGRENFGLNYSDFTLYDINGIKYNVTGDSSILYSYAETKGAANMGAQVPPGITVHYVLVFDINPEAKGLRLDFSQVNFGGKKSINLGV